MGNSGVNSSNSSSLFSNFSKKKFFECQIYTKHHATFYLTKNNLCYGCGKNINGQLGLGDNVNYYSPALLTLPNNEKISFISCGSAHAICLTENGLCYVWGENWYGQLGLGDKIDRSTPTLFSLPNNERISFVTCGYAHIVCLTENNLYYVWGWNQYGQLGLGDTNNRSIPTLFSLPNNERISFIYVTKHAICLTENNLCYVWGKNWYGELGLGEINNRTSPALLTLPNNERISFITSGGDHTVCLTEDNLCYVWGYNEYGQLGLGDTNNRLTPTLLSFPNNEKPYLITCGSKHTTCLTENNLIYSWGYNNIGQLGLGDTNNRLTPTLLTLPNNGKISFITCGGYHTICLIENNSCYGWGSNIFGELGLTNNLSFLSPTKIPFLKKHW